MRPPNKPVVALSGIDFLCLAIQSDPGRSQRHYLRRLHVYKWGYEDPHKGSTCCGYFTNDRYRDRLWKDVAPKTSGCRAWMGWKPCSASAQMHLTWVGWARANSVRERLGLEPLEMPWKGIWGSGSQDGHLH